MAKPPPPPRLPHWWPQLEAHFRGLDESIQAERTTIMAAIDDLNTVLTTLAADVSAAVTEIQDLLSKIGTPSDPAIAAAVAQLQTLATNLETAVAAAKTAAP